MQYLDRIKTDPPSEPDNALILGTALHTGIEKDVETALHEYAFSYPIITDEHINEMIKLEKLIPMVKAAIPEKGEHEVKISDDDFVGYIDYLVFSGKGVWLDAPADVSAECEYYDIYDFKYSNNTEHYMGSAQLHLYKYFFEKTHPGKRIRNLYFVFVPKIKIRQKKTETIMTFRERLDKELEKAAVRVVPIKYDTEKVIQFLLSMKAVYDETEFPKNESYLCRFCEFGEYCEKGCTYFMNLPKNERRKIESINKRSLWIYGAPFSGKTTFANNFPDPLMLNTDGNIKFVDAPYVPIRDEVKVEGRQTKRTLAWEIFKDTVAELEKKDNDFKTIIVDLLEDLYEHCRVYMYNEMNITHESDDSFRAWDKVRGEFLHTLKRLMNLDYENIILISHEDMSKDVTKKGGDKITAIKPNIQDKVATKVAGMVDVVGRIIADGDVRTFSFKSNEVIFGGGRLKVTSKDIPLDVNALYEVYDEANKNANVVLSTKTNVKTTEMTTEPVKAVEAENVKAEEETPSAVSVDAETGEVIEEAKPSEEEPPFETDKEAAPAEEKPRRRRKKREE